MKGNDYDTPFNSSNDNGQVLLYSQPYCYISRLFKSWKNDYEDHMRATIDQIADGYTIIIAYEQYSRENGGKGRGDSSLPA